MTYHFRLLALLAIGLMAVSCKNDNTPKPMGYYRIGFPAKTYHDIDTDYPFTCVIPDYCTLSTSKDNSGEAYWYNLEYPSYNAKVHLTYYTTLDTTLSTYIESSRQFAMEHIPKATAIKQKNIYIPQHDVYGLSYNIQGSGAASPIQFYVTDSVQHFLRGALYFYNTPNNDSVAPIINFIDEDLGEIIKSLRWE